MGEVMSSQIHRHVAEEIARRVARRLEVLLEERPDLLAHRLGRCAPETLDVLLELTRLPPGLEDREPEFSHVGVRGIDHCTDRLVMADGRIPDDEVPSGDRIMQMLDDDDLLAARRYVPETLPGYLLG